MKRTCAIIGGGVCGPSTALALTKAGLECTIYELRDSPSSIGGSVNVTPNALRLLEDLEVTISGCPVEHIDIFSIYSGKILGEISFRKHNSMRVVRKDLQSGLLAAVGKAGIKTVYGSKFESAVEDDQGKVTVKFANGTSAAVDFVVGCDGVHSTSRRAYVEPDRELVYTGVASAYSILDAASVKTKAHFESTALNMGQRGSLVTSYCDAERSRVYLAAVMSVPEQESKEGWRAQGKDQEATMKEVRRRFDGSAIPYISDLINQVSQFYFYPIFKLSPNGKWSKGNTLLLGDAAHGMPPQGESVGLAIEDSALLARVFEAFPEKNTREIIESYEKTRRPRIDEAYKEAVARWENVKDSSWLKSQIMEWLTWLVLWLYPAMFEKSHAYDVREEPLLV